MNRQHGTRAVASAVLAAAFSGTAWADECRHSHWGADDEIGSANLITAEVGAGGVQAHQDRQDL